MWMRTATHLQLFRFKCVAFVQQKYHNSISSSRGFCRFFERKCKKIKISRSENVSQAQQVHQDTVNLLRLCCTSPFSGLFRHTWRVAFYFSTPFLQCFSCISLYAYSLICIFQSVTDFCVRFSVPLPSHPAALFWAAAGLWLYFLQQKTAQAAFSGPSVLCRIPYIKRRAAPKSRPPTIQAML